MYGGFNGEIAPPQPPLKPVSGPWLKLILGAIALLMLAVTAATTTKSDRQPAPPPLTQPTLPGIRHSQSKSAELTQSYTSLGFKLRSNLDKANGGQNFAYPIYRG